MWIQRPLRITALWLALACLAVACRQSNSADTATRSDAASSNAASSDAASSDAAPPTAAPQATADSPEPVCGTRCGRERWAIKTLSDRQRNRVRLDTIIPATVEALAALPPPPRTTA